MHNETLKALISSKSNIWAVANVINLKAMISLAMDADISTIKLAFGDASKDDIMESIYYKESDGVAHINLNGLMMDKAGIWSYFGICDTGYVRSLVDRAANDPGIKSVIIHVDSPGGSIEGVNELYESIVACGDNKPVIADVTGMCASAAYWSVCGANKINVRPSSLVGSVGVYSVLTDDSEYFSNNGIKFYVVSTGDFKGLGADGKVSDKLIEDTMRIISGYNDMFLSSIKESRDFSDLEMAAITDGRVYLGKDALYMRLVDNVIGAKKEVEMNEEQKLTENQVIDYLVGCGITVDSISSLSNDLADFASMKFMLEKHGIRGSNDMDALVEMANIGKSYVEELRSEVKSLFAKCGMENQEDVDSLGYSMLKTMKSFANKQLENVFGSGRLSVSSKTDDTDRPSMQDMFVERAVASARKFAGKGNGGK